MPPKIALLLCSIFILLVFLNERDRNNQLSWAILIPFLWYAIAASRPVGIWLHIWGITIPGASDAIEGSSVDRWSLGLLTIAGVFILARRQQHWSIIFRENFWVVLLFFFMLISSAWSDYPTVSIKRFIKSFGAAIMALVLLSEVKPMAAISAVMRWCAYFHIPLSIITIKYFRHIGVSWDWQGGAASWVGIATSKNTLGQIAAFSLIIFLYERFRSDSDKRFRIIDWAYVVMAIFILKGSDDAFSLTSILVTLVGVAIFFLIKHIGNNINKVRKVLAFSFVSIAFILTILISSVFSLRGGGSLLGDLFQSIGRAATLTGRSDIWLDVISIASNHTLAGVGFGGFWIGKIVNIPWNEDMTWTLGQAHNGYLDVYLQLGVIGLVILVGVLIRCIQKISDMFSHNFNYGLVMTTFFIVICFVNITESTFLRGEHALWMLFLVTALGIPARPSQIGTARL